MDNSKTSFRNKVKSKFNPQTTKTPVNNKGKDTVKPTYVSPLPPPILAKMPKEVNEISKFFKIKEMFPKLQNNKIDQV